MSIYTSRIEKIEKLAREENLCGLVVDGQSNIFYLTGYRGAGVLAYREDGGVKLYVPMLEYLNAYDSLVESGIDHLVEIVIATPYKLPGEMAPQREGFRVENKGFYEAVAVYVSEECKKVGYTTNTLPLYQNLEKTNVELRDISKKIWSWRVVKEQWELERMTRALEVAEYALNEALDILREGVSELEVAATIEYEIKRYGAESTSFPTIVAFSENTVYPHATPSRRRILSENTPVLIDLGARYMGYSSDTTRTLFIGTPSKEFLKTADAVLEALYSAAELAIDGEKAGSLDAAARRVLEKHGYSSYFIHSLGHGIGIDVHEEPRLSHNSDYTLREGMVVTIEPGVYLRGRYGIRIENMVIIGKRKPKILNKYPEDVYR